VPSATLSSFQGAAVAIAADSGTAFAKLPAGYVLEVGGGSISQSSSTKRASPLQAADFELIKKRLTIPEMCQYHVPAHSPNKRNEAQMIQMFLAEDRKVLDAGGSVEELLSSSQAVKRKNQVVERTRTSIAEPKSRPNRTPTADPDRPNIGGKSI
jgi:hypothetical protein